MCFSQRYRSGVLPFNPRSHVTSEIVEKEVLACDPALVFTSFCRHM